MPVPYWTTPCRSWLTVAAWSVVRTSCATGLFACCVSPTSDRRRSRAARCRRSSRRCACRRRRTTHRRAPSRAASPARRRARSRSSRCSGDVIPSCVRGRRDVARSDDRRQLREHRVVGVRDRLREVDRPEVLALVVVHLPEASAGVDRHRLRRGEDRRRRDVLLQRGREHERLERRARLPLALRREVELVLVVVRAADHREHRAGALRVDRDERGRRVRAVLRQDRRDRIAARASAGRCRASSSPAARRRTRPSGRSGRRAGP